MYETFVQRLGAIESSRRRKTSVHTSAAGERVPSFARRCATDPSGPDALPRTTVPSTRYGRIGPDRSGRRGSAHLSGVCLAVFRSICASGDVVTGATDDLV